MSRKNRGKDQDTHKSSGRHSVGKRIRANLARNKAEEEDRRKKALREAKKKGDTAGIRAIKRGYY
ncbi:hypothetical protein COU76_00145 [Candidatus Peregrinibacteria bacterium CG10_big_fil_rev_8_21_14_0_10_49_10]|nr:MAG: hypothetical protein COU76_00145 [Candidatus Peregrinibacteria bacterium CG10_big_fil_rev_8_21_14_0_10_49_10]